jgi:hypothetical protein
MTIRYAVVLCSLTLGIFAAHPLRCDVLFDGKTPVDRGNGDTVGGEIRWIGCDGQHKTIHNPPYNVYKRAEDCKGLTPHALNAPDPDVFGLKCPDSGPFTFGEQTRSCEVTDDKLANMFLTGVHGGERVKFEKSAGKIVLQSGRGSMAIDTREWDDFRKLSQYQ